MDFINRTDSIKEYIDSCHHNDYNFADEFKKRGWNEPLLLPPTTEDTVDYCYQLLMFICDGPKALSQYTFGYSSSNKFADSISAFMRKTIEPFILALKSHMEIEIIRANEATAISIEDTKSNPTIFLSERFRYC